MLGLLCGIVGFRMAWRSGNKFATPLLQGAFGFVAFAAAWRVAGAGFAALAVAGWAIGCTLVSISVFRREPERVERQVLRARAYRHTMFEWLRTGRGPEARPLATAGTHAVELVLYVTAAALTVNLLSIVMGAVLLNYMNAYVARLLEAATREWTVRWLAWNVWSIVRVSSYVMLGSAAAGPLAARLGFPAEPAQLLWLAIGGGVGVVLDLVLKLALSRRHGRMLAAAIDPQALEPTSAGS